MKRIFIKTLLLLFVLASVCWAKNSTDIGNRQLSLDYFLAMDNDQRRYSDIAVVNLLCAQGLPGAENLDIRKCLSTIEKWAGLVENKTNELFPQFYRNPGEYFNSEGYFRMLVLVTVLSLDLGVKYNPDLIVDKPTIEDLKSTTFFRNSKYIFLHGAIIEKSGTCGSLPVLTTSVGRLLGYPLKLVNAKAHLFVRWEDDQERFNIESAGHGLKCRPDEDYMKWPFEITEAEMRTGFFLKSLSPTEEMASFLETRAFCLLENKKFAEARTFFEHAYSLYPNHPYIKGYIARIKGK